MIDLEFNGVSKKYRLRGRGRRPHTSWYRPEFLEPLPEMWALRDVSFQVKEGEALGIVGHNGAGKTTVLKILSSITTPTAGQIMVRGRLAALVEVSSGFHPELTGRENVYLHGAMLGMKRAEITHKLDSIIDFSGVADYIDIPVKRYSSGMYVRLGFSIAAHLDPDIILLDEVLAVGDAAFQAKCLDRIAEVRKSGRTMVFISHDLAAVYRLCDRALLLDHGRIVMDGAPRQVIDRYQQLTFQDQATGFSEHVASGKPAECKSVSFHAPDSGGEANIRTGYRMVTRVGFQAAKRIQGAVVRVSIFWPSGYLCAQLNTGEFELQPGVGRVEFRCPVLPVVPGLYRVDVAIEAGGQEIDARRRCATLRVDPGKPVFGDFHIENQWSVVAESPLSCTSEVSN
ncbi:MAG: ABC transporter ATP-binding protein [Acidobacteria bacterium]|nr:ABC transporter ATP-binding protein [Acidobacteriota bacterium]